MRKESTGSRSESRPEWEQLEDWVRGHVQRLIQELLEEEVTEFLGRAKSARRSDSDHDTGYHALPGCQKQTAKAMEGA